MIVQSDCCRLTFETVSLVGTSKADEFVWNLCVLDSNSFLHSFSKYKSNDVGHYLLNRSYQ
jgi:hypothetical protein